MTRCVLALFALPAIAAADPRITTRTYQPDSVVTLRGKVGIESTIAFASDERIENVAVGNSAVWQVTPNKRANLLFVKPAGAKAHTNMTVVTDQHTYLFDLVSTPGAAPVYMLRFSYPDAAARVVVAAAAITPVPAPEPVAETPEAAKPTPASQLRFAWTSKGEAKLLPRRVFDDGHATFLAWDADATLPAILVRDELGEEGPVNFTVKDDYIVVAGVPAQLILRSGKQMATLVPADRPARAQALADAGGRSTQP